MSDIKQLPIRVSEQELRDIEWLRRQLGERSMAHAVRRVLRERVEAMRGLTVADVQDALQCGES